MNNTTPPTECNAWANLVHHAESWRGVQLRELFANDVARAVMFVAEAPGLRLDYSRQRLGAMTLRMLSHLAVDRGLPEWRDALLSGQKVNSTEDRAAWHTALRAGGSLPRKRSAKKERSAASSTSAPAAPISARAWSPTR